MSHLKKILLAFVGFMMVLMGLIYLLFGVQFKKPHFISSNIVIKSETEKPKNKQFFYRSIGHSPINTTSVINKSDKIIKYTLEFKVFTDKALAERFVDTLNKQGIKAYYTPVQIKGRVLYRVRKGLYTSPQEAEHEAKELAQTKQVKAQVVKL